MRPQTSNAPARAAGPAPRLLLLAAALIATPVFAQEAAPVELGAAAVSAPAEPRTGDAVSQAEPEVVPAAPDGNSPQGVPTADDAPNAPEGDTTAHAAEGAPQAGVADSAAVTDAERDYQALYGAAPGEDAYNPVADPTLPAPAQVSGAYDPWEPYNRRMHRFNNAVDRHVAKPLATTYVKVVPRPMRLGVSNFFNNLGQPVSALNALLQGKPKQAAQSFGRFVLNTTLGIGGIFDPASDAKLPNRSEDFGQTLGVWGWKRSRYVELPLFGPRTVRDVVGLVGDSPLSPLRQVEADKIRVPIQGLQLVDVRTQLLSTDSLREGAEDDYALVRDAWSQRRDYQIFGDRQLETDDQLPDYLREENNPIVPVDALPVMPPSGG